MTKADLIERISNGLGLEARQSSDILEYLIETIKIELIKDGDISISGFGRWSTRKKNPRVGRNPKTGEEALISARRVVTFKPSKILRDVINE
ncbi:MAG: integration host factor subunit alpha [Deltaproteobacteria bacterium RIFOXYA12_FULL_61_11]|nr:MAG: integration host factor subunit alpha [Deltaproteobacteria bacterium RIFOXYA12_FULL_61_11]